jgi:tetratricopeptide (TPR) repeat protein
LAPEDVTGTVAQGLEQARRLLRVDPTLSLEQAEEVLKAAPQLGPAHAAKGMALAALARHEDAATALTRATQLDPKLAGAWRALGDQHTLLENPAEADRAYAQAIRASVNDPRLMQAALALCEGKLAVAEAALREHLKIHPTDVAAIRMLAEVGARLGRFDDAEKLLKRCLDLAPSFLAARHNYAIVLHRQAKGAEALVQVNFLLESDPDNPSFRFLKASALTRVGEYEQAIALYEDILRRHPNNARAWLSLGHARKTAGQTQASVDAYRKSIEIEPSFGEGYWSLANMKTYRFDEASVAQMRGALSGELRDEDRFHLEYALAKALEDRGDCEAAFAHYAEGARIRRAALHYDADETTRFTDRLIAQFSSAFLVGRVQQGSPAPDPIFVVGLPRSGSTLIEQMLASHSAIEGTMELPDLGMIAKALGGGKMRDGAYPEALSALDPDALARLGEQYIARTRVQRKTRRPFFIDKMPNNFQHIGLIRLILPNAKIIDARRHPMAGCFGAFKQHFARGQAFSYDLTDLGRYYADYVRLLDHFDRVQPGAVLRVRYERVVKDPEGEIRRLLAYCGLPYEAACLEFYTNERAVRTASSEQVRQPIYLSGLDHWRQFEPWLGPLRAALGPTVEAYERTSEGSKT